ncbi:MAG TPA: flagellar assembly protein T N-terminal domain-containing protein [Polyangia bacterium]
MGRTRTLIGAFVAVVAFTLIAVRAEARRTTVSAEGHAVIVGGSRAVARSQAINGALRAAVAQIAGTLGAAGDGDDSATDHNVYDRAAAFVPRSTVVSEDVDGNIFQVQISADVDVDALKVALGDRRSPAAARATIGGSAGERLDGKRVLILATEQLGPHRVFGWTDLVWTPGVIKTKTTVVREVSEMGGIEATVAEVFGGAGFHVVDPQVLRGKLAPKPAFETLDLSNGAAQQIAEKSDADYVVVAKGTAQLAYHADLAGAGMQSGQGNVVARLVRVRDGKVVAATTQHAAEVHIDADTARLNAINSAARLAAETLTRKLSD